MAVDPSDRFQISEDFKAALLASKSLTQQAPGSYKVEPLPAEPAGKAREIQATIVDEERSVATLGPVPPENANSHENQPFVSPLTKRPRTQTPRGVDAFCLVLRFSPFDLGWSGYFLSKLVAFGRPRNGSVFSAAEYGPPHLCLHLRSRLKPCRLRLQQLFRHRQRPSRPIHLRRLQLSL